MKSLKINKTFAELIPPLIEDEFLQLEENLKKEGWRKNEVIITWKGIIIDGHNRYKICKKNNIKFKTLAKNFKDQTSALIWMLDNQMGRRNLPDYARVRLALKKGELLKPIAKKNQRLSEGTGRKGKQISANLSMDTRAEVAKIAGVSHDTVSKVQFIQKKADKKTKKELDSGNKKLSINKVYNELKKKEKRQNIEKHAKIVPLPKKKYNIIYADPPWTFKHYSWKGKGKSPENYYKCMSLRDIKELPIEKLAANNCILFMWVTYPFLEKSFEVIKAWGFKYSTVGFTWVKRNKKSPGWFWGMGYWTRSNAEVCIIATKGSITRKSNSVQQIIESKIEGHSKKPDIVRDKIIELVGKLPRIELFARKKTKGWDVHGDEVN